MLSRCGKQRRYRHGVRSAGFTIISALLAMCFVPHATAKTVPPVCAAESSITHNLETVYKEKLIAVFMRDEVKIVLYANWDTQTWTIVTINIPGIPAGFACVTLAGAGALLAKENDI